MRLSIVGGGIGGLAAALFARRAGAEVVVHERAPDLREIGAGMTLWPNAVRVVDALGLLDELRGVASVFEESAVGDHRGRVWTRMAMGEVGRRAGHPTLLVARGALHQILARAARRDLGADAIRTGEGLVALEQDESVHLRFADGTGARADAVVGADGAASQVRRALFGERPLVFHGRTSFRGLSSVDVVTDADFVERHGPAGRFAFYRVGGGQLAWYANLLRRVEPTVDPKALLASSFGDWAEPVPTILAHAHGGIHVTAISDLEPLPRWTVGRVTLLGDAAHPMTPDLGQGAGQALEDAAALGVALRVLERPSAALSAYEASRRDRAREMVLGSRKTGGIANLGGHGGLLLRRALWSLLPPRVAIDRMTQVVVGRRGP